MSVGMFSGFVSGWSRTAPGAHEIWVGGLYFETLLRLPGRWVSVRAVSADVRDSPLTLEAFGPSREER